MNRIKELRESLGLKQTELVKNLSISQGTLSNWERGVHDPANEVLLQLADFFGVTTDYLLGKDASSNLGAAQNEISDHLLPSEENESPMNDITLSDTEIILLEEYRAADKRKKRAILQTALGDPADIALEN